MKKFIKKYIKEIEAFADDEYVEFMCNNATEWSDLTSDKVDDIILSRNFLKYNYKLRIKPKAIFCYVNSYESSFGVTKKTFDTAIDALGAAVNDFDRQYLLSAAVKTEDKK